MQKIPRSIEEFLALPMVYAFQGIYYRQVKPKEWKNERVYAIENKVEKWILVWDEGRFKRMRIPTKADINKWMIEGLRKRLPNT